MNRFFAVAVGPELDNAVHEAEQGEILTNSAILAGVELGAVLANNHAARADYLAGVDLHAEPLALGVSAVSGATHTLLMSHDILRLMNDLSKGYSLHMKYMMASGFLFFIKSRRKNCLGKSPI